MNRVFGLALILVSLQAHGQPPDSLWSQTYGGSHIEQTYTVRETTDGGYILTGWKWSTAGAGSDDLWLIRTDSEGDTIWTRMFGGLQQDRGASVVEVADGYVVAGRTASFPVGMVKVWLLKVGLDGDSLWSHAYGDTSRGRAYSVQQTSDGGFVVAGIKGWLTNSDFWLIKTDANGDSMWSRTYGTSNIEDWCNSIKQTTDGGYVMAGYSGSHYRDMRVVKTNANGEEIWSRSIGGFGDETCRNIEQTADGNYLLGGNTTSFGSTDMWLVKMDTNGDTLWTRAYGTIDSTEECYWVEETADSGYVLAGYQGATGDMLIVRTNAEGDTLWTRRFGGVGEDLAYSVQQTADCGYVVAGYTHSYGAGGSDGWLVRMNRQALPIIEIVPALPQEYSFIIYPNPFNHSTTISFALPKADAVKLLIYDITGREVAVLADKQYPAGEQHLVFNGFDLPSGIYFAHLSVGAHEMTQKLLLVK